MPSAGKTTTKETKFKKSNRRTAAKSPEAPPPEAPPPVAPVVDAVEKPSESVETPGGTHKPNKRTHPKNFVGSVDGNGNSFPFALSDSNSISDFVAQYGNMGEGWPDAGYETHFNNCGPLQRSGVVRLTNQGKAKVMAVFADSLACDAANAGRDGHGLPKGRDPEQAVQLLEAFHQYLGGLIERKKNERNEAALAAAAQVAGVSVEELKALRDSKQNSNT